MMKVKFKVLLAVTLAASLFMTACGSTTPDPAPAAEEPEAETEEPEPEAEEPAAETEEPAAEAEATEPVDLASLTFMQDIIYATNPISTGNYTMSAAQGAQIASKLGINVVVQPTSGPEGIAIALQENAAQMGIVAGGLIPEPWGDKADSFKICRTLQGGEKMCFGLVTREDLGIKSIADLKGKRVTYEGLSVSHTQLAETMMQVYGVDPKTDITPLSMAFSTAGLTDLAEGRTDASIASIAGSKMDELASKVTPFVLPVDKEHAEKCRELSDGLMVPGVMNVDLPGAPKGTELIAMMNQIVVREDVEDDTVYAMARILLEDQAELAKVAADLEYWTEKVACTPDSMYPYHAGAIRYYKEIGIWTDEMDKWNNEVLAEYGLTR
ncbi:TAXI family TRAP transporter solute-binding subunit [Lachnospiraceae bacterium ZAX-1]